MIDTNLPEYLKDLNEVVDLFENCNEFKIRHRISEKPDRVVNTVTVNGQTFAYGNLIGNSNDPIIKKRLLKRFSKLSLYKALSKITGQELPWGALTGIRPTKLAYDLIKDGEDFQDFFIDTMKVSPEKLSLLNQVIVSQKSYYEINDDNTDFFIFIPFCPSRCKYCSFITQDINSALKNVDVYVDCLIKEIQESSHFIKKLRSIYIGGGTPVSLSNANLLKILKEIEKFNSGVEFTVEAGRPDLITSENLKILKDFGVNRICINPQTFNDNTLKLLNRTHTGQDIIDKYYMAKNDFTVNMDLIAGLDGEDFNSFKYSIDKTVSLNPDNITVHTLCLKNGSKLKEDCLRLPKGEIDKMVNYARDIVCQNGYNPYYLYRQRYMAGNLENVGYCKPGKQCVYNIDTMEEISSTIACGAGAISKKVKNKAEFIDRYPSPKDVLTYISKIDKIIQDKKNFFD